MSQLNSPTPFELRPAALSAIVPTLKPAAVVRAQGEIRVSERAGMVGINVFGTYAVLDPHAALSLIAELTEAYETATGVPVWPL